MVPGEGRGPETGGRPPGARRSGLRLAVRLVGPVVAVAVVASLALLAVLAWTVSPGRLASRFLPRLEATLGREVTVGDVSLDLFPRPSLRLEEVGLGAAPGFGPDPALAVGTLGVGLRILPLLRGRVRPSHLHLERPLLRLEVGPDGRTSLSTGRPEGGDGPLAAVLALALFNVRIDDGRVLYHHRDSGARASFGVEGRVRAGQEGSGVLPARGELHLRSLRASLPGNALFDSLLLERATLTWDLRVDPAGDSLVLREATLAAGGGRIRAAGTVRKLASDRILELGIESDELPLGELTEDLTGGALERLAPRGRLRIAGEVRGVVGTAAPLEVRGRATLREGSLALGGGVAPIEGLRGDLRLTPDSAVIPDLSGTLAGRHLRAEVRVARAGAERPAVVRIRLNGQVEVGLLRVLLSSHLAGDGQATREDPRSVGTGSEGAGEARGERAETDRRETEARARLEGLIHLVNFVVEGPPFDPAGFTLRGDLRLEEGVWGGPPLAVPLRIPDARLRWTGGGLELPPTTILPGADRLQLSASVQGLLPLGAGSRRGGRGGLPTVGFTLVGSRLDATLVLGLRTDPDARRPDGRSPPGRGHPAGGAAVPLRVRPATGTAVPSTGSVFLTARGLRHPLDPASLRVTRPIPPGSPPFSPPAPLSRRPRLPRAPRSFPSVLAEGEVRLDTLLLPRTELRDLRFSVRTTPGELRIVDLAGRLHGGRLAGSLSFREPRDPGEPMPARFDLTLRETEGASLFRSWTETERPPSGILDLTLAGTTRLSGRGAPFVDVLRSIRAEGHFRLVNGSLEGLPAVERVAATLGLPADALGGFRRLEGPFRILDGRLEVQGWELEGEGVEGTLEGWLAPDGPLDLSLSLRLPLDLLRRSSLLGPTLEEGGLLARMLESVAGEAGVLPLELEVRGTTENPIVNLGEGSLGRLMGAPP